MAQVPGSAAGEANGGCPERPRCEGQQWYEAASNRCREPICDAYYFQEVDPSTHLCRYAPRYFVLVMTLGLTLVAMQLGSVLLRTRWATSVRVPIIRRGPVA